MPDVQESPPIPLAFVIASFAGAIVVGIAIAYFGIRGQIGAGIP